VAYFPGVLPEEGHVLLCEVVLRVDVFFDTIFPIYLQRIACGC
jgi:hypothetical protein